MKEKRYLKGYEIEEYHWWCRAKREIVLGLAEKELDKLSSKGRLIDFGCGPESSILRELAKYGEVTGVDFSELAINLAKKRFNGNFHQLDLSKPIEPWTSFDFAICLDVLEHIEADEVAAQNIYQFLRPGGTCVITVPAYQWLWAPTDESCMHKRRYNRQRLCDLLEKTGFEIEYIGYYMTLLFPPAALVRLVSKCINKESESIEDNSGNGFLNTVLYKIFIMEKSWICKGHTFPYGLSLIAKVHRPRLN